MGIIPIVQMGKLRHWEGNWLSLSSLAARRQRLDFNADPLSRTHDNDLSPLGHSPLLPVKGHCWKSPGETLGVVSCELVTELGLNTIRGPKPC